MNCVCVRMCVQADTVKSTKTHVLRCAAKMGAAVRVQDLMLLVPAPLDT